MLKLLCYKVHFRNKGDAFDNQMLIHIYELILSTLIIITNNIKSNVYYTTHMKSTNQTFIITNTFVSNGFIFKSIGILTKYYKNVNNYLKALHYLLFKL